jgi:hypothetical protein
MSEDFIGRYSEETGSPHALAEMNEILKNCGL